MDSLERAAIKALCESSLLFFARYFFKQRFGDRFIVNPHHTVICKELQDLVEGTSVANIGEPGPTEILIINVPPRYTKTELAVINFVPWCYVRNPGSKFIHLSYSDKLVLDNSAQIRDLMKLKAFQELWPISFREDVDAKGLWRTDAGGGFLASPAGGSVTGFGAGATSLGCFGKAFAGALLIDDPLKPSDARSDLVRQTINERLPGTFMSRRNSRETPIILTMQRIHENDMTGYVLAGKTGLRVRHIKLPALDEEGTALWPHKHTADELRAMRRASPYIFSGQYQQEPTPAEGVVLKREWIQHDISGDYPVMKRIVVAIDPAVTAHVGSDETGIVVCGLGIDGRGYILDDVSGILTPDQWANRAVNSYDYYEADLIIGEVNNGGDLVESNVRAKARHVNFKAVRASRGKVIRLEPVAALYERGLITHCKHFDKLETQMCGFNPEKMGKSPDRLDALVWGLTELMLSGHDSFQTKLKGM